MAKKARNERTSGRVASQAAKLLQGETTAAAETWLRAVARSRDVTVHSRRHAAHLIMVLAMAKRVAASALTQR